MPQRNQFPIVAILFNIRSLYNVGSMFRTADALGITKLYLIGSTGQPHPDEPWRTDHRRLAKTALGAEQTVPWTYYPKITPAIQNLRHDGFTIISLEINPTSRPLSTWSPLQIPLAIIVGNEVTGLTQEITAASDVTLHIPMHGLKESLNVAVSFGIAAFWLKNQK